MNLGPREILLSLSSSNFPDRGQAPLLSKSQQHQLLAALLSDGTGPLLQSLLLGKAQDLKSAVSGLSPEDREALKAQTGTGLDHWSQLAQETSPEFFHRGLYSLGRKAEDRGSGDLAVRVYEELLGNAAVKPELQASAQERLALMSGGGSVGGKIEKYTEGAVAGVLDLSLLVGIGVGGMGFRVGRMWGANFLGGPGKLGWNQVLAVNAVGMGVELPAFTAAAKLTRMGLGHEENWSGRAFGEEMLGMGLLLGPVRLLQGGMKGLHGLRYGLNGPKAKLYQQAGMLGGIGIGHGLQQLVGYREFQGAGDFVLETLYTWGHFNAAGYVAHRVLPKSVRRFEERLERRTQELMQDGAKRAQDLVGPWSERAQELFNQGVRVYATPEGGKFSNLVLMAAGQSDFPSAPAAGKGSGKVAGEDLTPEKPHPRDTTDRYSARPRKISVPSLPRPGNGTQQHPSRGISEGSLARGLPLEAFSVSNTFSLVKLIRDPDGRFQENVVRRDTTIVWEGPFEMKAVLDVAFEQLNQLPNLSEVPPKRIVELQWNEGGISFTLIRKPGGFEWSNRDSVPPPGPEVDILPATSRTSGLKERGPKDRSTAVTPLIAEKPPETFEIANQQDLLRLVRDPKFINAILRGEPLLRLVESIPTEQIPNLVEVLRSELTTVGQRASFQILHTPEHPLRVLLHMNSHRSSIPLPTLLLQWHPEQRSFQRMEFSESNGSSRSSEYPTVAPPSFAQTSAGHSVPVPGTSYSIVNPSLVKNRISRSSIPVRGSFSEVLDMLHRATLRNGDQPALRPLIVEGQGIRLRMLREATQDYESSLPQGTQVSLIDSFAMRSFTGQVENSQFHWNVTRESPWKPVQEQTGNFQSIARNPLEAYMALRILSQQPSPPRGRDLTLNYTGSGWNQRMADFFQGGLKVFGPQLGTRHFKVQTPRNTYPLIFLQRGSDWHLVER